MTNPRKILGTYRLSIKKQYGLKCWILHTSTRPKLKVMPLSNPSQTPTGCCHIRNSLVPNSRLWAQQAADIDAMC